MASAFAITQGKGFHMTLNGYTVSVQFGPGSYADMPGGRFQDYDKPLRYLNAGDAWEANTAEIAIWSTSGDWLRLQECDTVAGWVTAVKVAEILGVIAAATNEDNDEVTKRLREILRRK